MPIGKIPRKKDSMRPIFEENAHYLKALYHFSSKAYNNEVQEWADGDFVPAVLDKLENTVESSDKLRILGVGCGTGDIELIFLKKILSRFTKCDACFVEPSQDLISKHQAFVEEHKSDLEGVDFNWKRGTLQEHGLGRKYLETGSPKYHFIFILHLSKIIDELETALKEITDTLQSGGVLMVTAVAEDTGVDLIGKTFPNLGRPKTTEGADSSSKTNRSWNSRDVRLALNSLSISYNLHQYIQYIDIGSGLEDQSSTDSGLILDFLSQTISFNKTAPANLQQEFVNCLKEKCVEKKNDRSFFLNKIDVHLISI